MRDCSWVPRAFPGIRPQDFDYRKDCKSDRDPRYNCIAWAVGKTDNFWWPQNLPGYFWPPGLPKEPLNQETIDNFIKAFKTEGYRRCRNGKFHRKYEKIALYVSADRRPKHAARLLASGIWTSKLGNWEDIEHRTLQCVEGGEYGRVVMFFKRKLPEYRRDGPLTRFRSFLSQIFVKRQRGFSPIPKENPTAS